MDCLFCYDPEPEYKPGAGIDFICSRCVQILLEADQQDLKRAHVKAIEKGFTNKAAAIESFLVPEGMNEQRKPGPKKCERHFNRKGIVRAFRDKEKRIGRSKVPA